MKHFIYTYSEKFRKDRTYKTVQVYRLIRNTPKLVASSTDTYVSEFQHVMQTMEAHKLLPRGAFERNQFGGFRYAYPNLLKEAGFANVNRI